MAEAPAKDMSPNQAPRGISDPSEVGILMLTICDRINESRDALSGDIRDFMTRVKELNGLYAQRCKEVEALEKLVSELKQQIESAKMEQASAKSDVAPVPPGQEGA
jgi:outer membrane murein-binding lipoprotein Lpp